VNFKVRFLILVIANVILLLGLFAVLFTSNVDLSSRLVDLNLSDASSRVFLFKFIGLMLGVFGINFILGLGTNDLSNKEINEIADVFGRNVSYAPKH